MKKIKDIKVGTILNLINAAGYVLIGLLTYGYEYNHTLKWDGFSDGVAHVEGVFAGLVWPLYWVLWALSFIADFFINLTQGLV